MRSTHRGRPEALTGTDAGERAARRTTGHHFSSRGSMIVTRAAAVALAVLVGTPILAQTPDRKLEFEVASVRPSSKVIGDTAPVALGLRLDGSQARIGALTIRDYIAMAYRIKAYQVMGAEWVATERFDVNAKLPEGSTVDQIPAMIQSLLAERFALKFHREPREQPVYM